MDLDVCLRQKARSRPRRVCHDALCRGSLSPFTRIKPSCALRIHTHDTTGTWNWMDTGESDSYIVGKCGIQTHGPIHGSAYDRDPISALTNNGSPSPKSPIWACICLASSCLFYCHSITEVPRPIQDRVHLAGRMAGKQNAHRFSRTPVNGITTRTATNDTLKMKFRYRPADPTVWSTTRAIRVATASGRINEIYSAISAAWGLPVFFAVLAITAKHGKGL